VGSREIGPEKFDSYVHGKQTNDVMEQDNTYSVSFLKKHTNGSNYYWPNKG